MAKSEKIEYKGKTVWINSEDFQNPEIKQLFVYRDKDLTRVYKTIRGTVIINKTELDDKLKEGYWSAPAILSNTKLQEFELFSPKLHK